MRSLCISVASLLLVSCALSPLPRSLPLPSVELDFFVPAPPQDPWRSKIEDWQLRHDQDPAVQAGSATSALGTPGAAGASKTELAREYEAFSKGIRRRIVEDTVAWVQENSRDHYRPDGDHDHWATLGEVVESGADDCDGLDLLAFVLLRRLGFQTDEIYRSIIVERISGQHHMVTLWFEGGRRDDPFVLDPTGVVAKSLVRLSEIEGWEPIQLFDERVHFRVESAPASHAVAQR